jgi:hypothetical protein
MVEDLAGGEREEEKRNKGRRGVIGRRMEEGSNLFEEEHTRKEQHYRGHRRQRMSI